MKKKILTVKAKWGYSRWVGTLSLAALAVVIVGVGAVTAGTDSPAKEYVAKALADFANANANSEIAGKVAQWLNGEVSVTEDDEFGATLVSGESVAGNFERVALCDSDKPSDACVEQGSEMFRLGVSSSTPISWCNRGRPSAKTVWIDHVYGQIFATGTPAGVAASMQFTMGTSSVTGVTLTGNGYNFNTSTAPNASILDRFVIATSTAPYVDNWGGTNWSAYLNEYGNGVAATGSMKSVPLKSGECLLGFLRAFDPSRAVTSTENRGMSTESFVIVDYHITNTSTSR